MKVHFVLDNLFFREFNQFYQIFCKFVINSFPPCNSKKILYLNLSSCNQILWRIMTYFLVDFTFYLKFKL